jgi:hypothetical protein
MIKFAKLTALTLLVGCVCGPTAKAQYYGTAAGYNPYTGVGGTASAAYNPYTGARAAGGTAYNPYTGGTRSAEAGYNPSTGTAATSRSYTNPYTGASANVQRAYNRTRVSPRTTTATTGSTQLSWRSRL